MPETRKAILWGREDVLGNAVQLFLTAQKGWEVIRISDEHSAEELIRQTEQIQPAAVIIYQGDCSFETPLPMQLMKICPRLKVLLVSLDNNSVELYNKQEVCVKGVTDLLEMVDS